VPFGKMTVTYIHAANEPYATIGNQYFAMIA
jgi:hypothetical protein